MHIRCSKSGVFLGINTTQSCAESSLFNPFYLALLYGSLKNAIEQTSNVTHQQEPYTFLNDRLRCLLVYVSDIPCNCSLLSFNQCESALPTQSLGFIIASNASKAPSFVFCTATATRYRQCSRKNATWRRREQLEDYQEGREYAACFFLLSYRQLAFEVHEVGRQGWATIDLPAAGLFSKLYVSEETVVVDVDLVDSQQALSQKSNEPCLFGSVVSNFSSKV